MQTIKARDAATLDKMIEALGWPVLDLWVDGAGWWQADLGDTWPFRPEGRG